jgi:hypothetical protein
VTNLTILTEILTAFHLLQSTNSSAGLPTQLQLGLLSPLYLRRLFERLGATYIKFIGWITNSIAGCSYKGLETFKILSIPTNPNTTQIMLLIVEAKIPIRKHRRANNCSIVFLNF